MKKRFALATVTTVTALLLFEGKMGTVPKLRS